LSEQLKSVAITGKIAFSGRDERFQGKEIPDDEGKERIFSLLFISRRNLSDQNRKKSQLKANSSISQIIILTNINLTLLI